MAVLNAEVVIRPIDVRRDNGSEIAAVLVLVAAVHHVDHALRVRVAFIGMVWRAQMHHGFINWVRGSIGEYTGGKTRHELLDLKRHNDSSRRVVSVDEY